MAPETPTPNGKSKLREEFISWNTVKHVLILMGVLVPLVGALWAWTASAQAQTIQLATTLGENIKNNNGQHDKYDKVLESTSKAIETNSRAIDRVAECMKNHLDYEKLTEIKLDRMLTEQRQMLRSTRDSVTAMQVEQRVLRDEIKRLAEEVKKNGSH